jgi:hypothetical protein
MLIHIGHIKPLFYIKVKSNIINFLLIVQKRHKYKLQYYLKIYFQHFSVFSHPESSGTYM